jgi:hypothetical protein
MLVLAVLGLASPAEACHRFHTWRYPYPQNCGVRLAGSVRQPQPEPARVSSDALPAPAPDEDHSWFVEIVLPDADPARTQGLAKLKDIIGAEKHEIGPN